MPQAIYAVVTAVEEFAATELGQALIATAISYAASEITASQAQKEQANARKKLAGIRDITVRSTVAPQQIVYGRARVSGPLTYINTVHTLGSKNNTDFVIVVPVAGHRIDAVEDVWLDSKRIAGSNIAWSTTGEVTGGEYLTKAGPAAWFTAGYGTTDQLASSYLTTNYPADITSAYRGRGIAYVVARLILADDTKALFTQQPENVHYLVRGKRVYDPRKDPTDKVNYRGFGAHVLGDESTWEWSSNPALCVADYITDTTLGWARRRDSIDWSYVARAADVCDERVTTPSGTQPRFSCNGQLFTTDSHRDNLRALLSSMNGTVVWTGGKFRVWAGAFGAPGIAFTQDDLAGPIQIRTARQRSERYNAVRGIYFDASTDYQQHDSQTVTAATFVNRDGGETFNRDISLPFTATEFEAQRLAWKMLLQSDQQRTAVIPVNLRGMKVSVGDWFTLTVPELAWNAKIFRCIGWRWVPEQGCEITAREDSVAAYADPAVTDYVTTVASAAPTVTTTDVTVPPPSNLAATTALNGVMLTWSAPAFSLMVSRYNVYRSTVPAFSAATKIGESSSTSFFDANGVSGTYYYWVTSVAFGTGAESERTPLDDLGISVGIAAGATSTIASSAAEYVWISNDGGVTWNPTTTNATLKATFSRGGTMVASVEINATLTQGTGIVTVSQGVTYGESLLVAIVNQGTAAPSVRVTHSASGAVTFLSFFANKSTSAVGSSPGGPSK